MEINERCQALCRTPMAPRLVAIALSAALTVAVTPVSAQESQGPIAVEVRQMDELLGTLRRIEGKLDQLLGGRWEYTSVQRNRLRDQDEVVRALGKDGWELVNVTVEEGFIFKRRVRSSR